MSSGTVWDTLYARKANGVIKQWQIAVYYESDYSKVITSYGEVGGKIAISDYIVKEGKNIGKSNETDHHQQAILEAESKFEKQLKLGYKRPENLLFLAVASNKEKIEYLNKELPLSNTDNNENLIPMKCQPYFKEVKRGGVVVEVPRIKFPCYGQPKINGVRCLVSYENEKVIFRSKKGLEYTILEHIAEQFTPDMFEHEGIDLIYDGELYIHDTILSDIISAVRTRQLSTTAVKFYCFDLALEEYDQTERLNLLRHFYSRNLLNGIVLVPYEKINSHEEALAYRDKCIADKFEGAIFRDPNALYGFSKRPQTITKYKKYIEQEFRIIDVISEEKTDHGLFVCIHKGKTFKVTPEGSHEQKAEYLRNKINYIGKMLTVQFYEWTINEIPFHAKGIAVRDYE